MELTDRERHSTRLDQVPAPTDDCEQVLLPNLFDCYRLETIWAKSACSTTATRFAAFDDNGNEIGIVFETASPFDTPQLMTELVDWMAETNGRKDLHPLLVNALFIVAFLAIHPFQDGNGRLSRILTTLLLLRAEYAYVPYSSLESVIEQSKESYYLALRQTQRTIRSDTPNWQPWLIFSYTLCSSR